MNRHRNLPWNADKLQHLISLADAGQLGHAYLLQGQQGLGKEDLALDFAQHLFCRNRQQHSVCGNCQGCRLFVAGTHPDFKILQIEEGSTQIKIEQVRESLTFLANTALLGGNKILLINPAEALNINAANALLKNLEEPAPGTVLFLISHQPARLLPTIRSRCQQIKVASPDAKEVLGFVQQAMPPKQAKRMLVMAGGAPLKALEYANTDRLDDAGAVHKSLLQLMKDRSAIHDVIVTLTSIGLEFVLENMLAAVNELVRNLQLMSLTSDRKGSNESDFSTAELEELSTTLSQNQLINLHLFYQELLQTRKALQSTANPNPQLLLESVCYQWITIMQGGRLKQGNNTARLAGALRA